MARNELIREVKAARTLRGLTMDEAGAMIVIGGEPTKRATWHGWEWGRKVPRAAAMFEIERVFGIPPRVFYPQPDGAAVQPEPPRQAALAL